MNRLETMALFKQGKDEWNKWAKNLRAQWKAKAVREDDWVKAWNALARADFRGVWFRDAEGFTKVIGSTKAIDFSGFIFPGDADFFGAQFHQEAQFLKARFLGGANFSDVQFDEEAYFNGARFIQEANFFKARFHKWTYFNGARFLGGAMFLAGDFKKEAYFNNTRFHSIASFNKVHFEDLANFNNAHFKEEADFSLIEVKGRLLLKGTWFNQLPNFTQANLVVPPDLDDTKLPEEPSRLWPLTQKSNQKNPQENNEIKWRALKRMAETAKNHILARKCFKGETLSRRRWVWVWVWPWDKNNKDKDKDHLFTGAFWAGLFFELLSDFGQSFVRPFLWLILLCFAFTNLYFWVPSPAPVTGSSTTRPQPVAISNACVSGKGDRMQSALLLSLSKTLFIGSDPTGKLADASSCLYGQTSPGKPNIPDSVAWLMLLQMPLALILLFLFAHAVKARFTIS